MAKKLSQFIKTEHRDIPVLKYGKNTRKRDLGYIGFENFYDYVDYSSIDDYGNPIPEYEIQYFNRKNRTIDDFIRDIDILLPFEQEDKRLGNNDTNDIGVIAIERFDITAPKPEITRHRNDLELEYEILNEIRDFIYRTKCIIYNET